MIMCIVKDDKQCHIHGINDSDDVRMYGHY